MIEDPIPAPFVSDNRSVPADWIDLNGHMNIARYLQAFDEAFDEAYEVIGINKEYMEQARGSTFACEIHLTYQRELFEGDRFRVTTQLVNFDLKRMHWIQCMYHREQGYLAATAETLYLHIDIDKRAVVPMPAALEQRFTKIMSAQASLPVPPQVGRKIDFHRRRENAS